MPNWCENEIQITGPSKEIQRFIDLFELNELAKDEYPVDGHGTTDIRFDMDKLVKMPEDLDIVARGTSEFYLYKPKELQYTIEELYHSNKGRRLGEDGKAIDFSPRTKFNVKAMFFEEDEAGWETVKGMKLNEFIDWLHQKYPELDEIKNDDFRNKPLTPYDPNANKEPEQPKDVFHARDFLSEYYYGLKLQENIRIYGHPHWYDWNYANLGCKWSSSEIFHFSVNGDINKDEIISLTLAIDTPWSPPIGFYKKLSAEFPSLDITVEYIEYGCDFAGHVSNGEDIPYEAISLSPLYVNYAEDDIDREELTPNEVKTES